MKNCIDDNNPDHNSVKGLFSEGEIKEAFDTLDMNKNGHITAEDLAFFRCSRGRSSRRRN